MSPKLIAGRYRLDSMIGRGSVGEVWQAQDILLQRTVAVKLVDLDANDDSTVPERFRREGVAIAGLNHPNIVKVYDTGTDGSTAFLVMDLLSGPNLSTLVREAGPLDYTSGLQILSAVASGLQVAHDSGITHRDVKPANIVLTAPKQPDGVLPDLIDEPAKGIPILVDFGIARIMNETETQLTGVATAIGTAAYMSPEQAMNKAIGSESDIYSLGCVAYFLFAGRPPFAGDSSVAVAHAQVYDEPLPLTDLRPDAPLALDALLSRMLSKKASERPTAAQASQEMAAIAADPSITPHYKATETIPAISSRRAALAPKILIAVVIAMLLILLAFSWLRPGTSPEPIPTVTLTQTQTQTATQTQTPAPNDNQREPGNAPAQPNYPPAPAETSAAEPTQIDTPENGRPGETTSTATNVSTESGAPR